MGSRRGTRILTSDEMNSSYSLTSMEEHPAMSLEDSLTNDRLKELEFLFQVFDVDDSGGLDMDEFRHIMRTAVDKNLSDEECDRLFMKVDTNCDGNVDWDELLSYMLLEIQEKDAMKEIHQSKLLPNTMRKVENIERYQNLSDSVIKIEYIPRFNKSELGSMEPYWAGNGKYVTVTKAGVINFWNEAMVHQLRYQLPAPKVVNRDLGLWVMAMAVLQNMSIMAIATTAGTLMFFDINAYSFIKCLTIKHLDICITCLTFWTDPDMREHSILMFGDARGSVMVLDFKDVAAATALFQPPSKYHGSTISFTEMLKNPGMFAGITAYKHPYVHHDLVIDIKFYMSLHGFISCCNSNKSAMYLGDLTGGKSYIFNSSKGIQAFDFYPTTNIIVTGGKDGEIRIWNPYVPSKPIMILQGQITPIILVQVDKEREKILTVSVEKEIVIYDMLTQVAVQVIKRKDINLGERVLSAACYNPYRKALILGNNQLALFEHQEEDIVQQKFLSHLEPVTCLAYNSVFDQLVSGAINGVVCVWHPSTGAMAMRFTAHKIARQGTEDVAVEVTCICFDPTERRLITAGRDGCVKIWNFNNGALLRVLEDSNTTEITGIVCPPKRIMTAGWNRRIQLYVDTYEDVSVRVWDQRHKADITHLAFRHPSVVASGDNNGDILIWNIESSNISLRLNANVGTKPCSFNDLISAEEWQYLKSLAKDGSGDGKSGKRRSAAYRREIKLDEFLHYNTQQRQMTNVIPYVTRQHSRSRVRGRKLALYDGTTEVEEIINLQSAESSAKSSKQSLRSTNVTNINMAAAGNTNNNNNKQDHKRDGKTSVTVEDCGSDEEELNIPNDDDDDDDENTADENDDDNYNDNNNDDGDDISDHVTSGKYRFRSDAIDGNRSNNNTASNISFLLKRQRSLRRTQSGQSSSGSSMKLSKAKQIVTQDTTSESSISNEDIKQVRRRIRRRMEKISPDAEIKAKLDAAKDDKQQKYDRYVRKNETAIERLLFLTKRESDPNTATLIAVGACGWVRFWSVDHRGGMLGQFNAAHVSGDSVHAMCVDDAEEYLVTGDSEGYIKVWDIAEYCNSSATMFRETSESRRRKRELFPLLFHQQHDLLMKCSNQGRHRPPPQSTNPDVTWHAPSLLNSFRAHLDTVSGITYIPKGERIATASRDCSIRMWTIFGRFIGICGQEVPWPILTTHELIEDESHEKILLVPPTTEDVKRRRAIISPKVRDIPGDIRRVASATTLRVIAGGVRSNWRRTRAVMMMVVPMQLRLKRMSTHGKKSEKSLSGPSDATFTSQDDSDSDEDYTLPTLSEMMANLETTRTTELGKFFQTNRCHHPLPKLPKIRCFNHQVSVGLRHIPVMYVMSRTFISNTLKWTQQYICDSSKISCYTRMYL